MTDVERIKYMCDRAIKQGACPHCFFERYNKCIFRRKPCMWDVGIIRNRMQMIKVKQVEKIIEECRKSWCNRCKLWNGYECAFLNTPLFWDTEFINDKVRMKHDE